MLNLTPHILIKSFIIKPILKYRLHITFLFAISLFLISGKKPWLNNIIMILNFSLCHFAFHLYNRALDRESDAISNPKEALKDEKEVPKLKLISYGIAIVAILNTILWQTNPFLIILCGLMAFLYNNFFGINLKKIFFLKNLYMALFYGIPFCLYNYSVFNTPITFNTALSFLNYLFTILAIEALWDIKDIIGDKMSGVKTIANCYGITYTKVYATILMLAAWYPQYLLYGTIVYYSTFLIIYYLFFLRQNCSVWHYHGPLILILIPTIIKLYLWL